MTDWTTPRAAPVSLRRDRTLRSRALDRESPLRRLDWLLLMAVLLLCAAGTLLVWSATNERSFLTKNVVNIAIGLVLGGVAAVVDYRALRAYAPIVYVASCIGLVAVLSPLGSTVNGAHSWIRLGGGFELQPSEFAKVALVVGLAMLLGEKRDGEDVPRDIDVVQALLLAGVPMLLILLQPDLGTTLVFVFVILGVVAVSGAPTRWVVGLVLAGGVVGLVIAKLHLLKPYQLDRLTAFANPNAGHGSFGYQTAQARITTGSGGLFGKGLFHGPLTNGHFVPEQQTDFIFTVAGEELGFIGCALIVLLLGVVLWRGLRIAAQAGDTFGTLMATGVTCWLAFQSFENIGMAIGIMPMTGIPLPFLSYGGSSMFAVLIAIGLLQNVHMRSRD